MWPESTFQLDKQLFVMLRVCLDDHETSNCTSAAEDFARATVPRQSEEVIHAGHDDRYRKRTVGSGASPQELLQWRPRVPLSHSHFPLAPARIVWDMQSEQQPTGDPQATVLSINGIGANDHKQLLPSRRR